MSSIPGSVGYLSYSMFIEPTTTWVPSGFSGYIWLDTKIVFTKIYFVWTHEISNECFIGLIFTAPCDSSAHETWTTWLAMCR